MPMTLSRLDLPEPEGPMMEMNSPSRIDRLISFRMKLGLPPTVTHLEMRLSSIIMTCLVFVTHAGPVGYCLPDRAYCRISSLNHMPAYKSMVCNILTVIHPVGSPFSIQGL